MILPTKHIRPERALLTIGAEVLGCLREPMTVSRVWDELRKRRGETSEPSAITYDWFISTRPAVHREGSGFRQRRAAEGGTMIYSITSDLDSFKPLTFGPGLNILLAEKSADASDRQSRNGAGKTSFVELVHFLFGGNAKPDSIFRTNALIASTFEMQVDIGGYAISAGRSGLKPSCIRIQGETSHWPIKPTLDAKTGDLILSNEHWKSVLGTLLFGLPADPRGA